MNVAMLVVGRALGVDWKLSDGVSQKSDAPAAPEHEGLTISEIAAAVAPSGGNLTQASAEVLRQMGLG